MFRNVHRPVDQEQLVKENENRLYRAALADRRLFAAARAADPLLTDTLLASLRAVRTHCEDDADLLRKIRRTLVHRLDGRFAAGNREPLYAPGDKPA